MLKVNLLNFKNKFQMSNQQQLINDCVKLANKGIYDKSFIYKLIKHDFHIFRQKEPYKKIGDIYKDLGFKYDYSAERVRKIIAL